MSNACAEKEGVVTRDKGAYAYVEIAKTEVCNGCKACSFGSNKTVSLPVSNPLGAKKGDRVVVTLPPSRPVLSFTLLIFLPLCTTLIAFFVASAVGNNEIYAVLFALGGLLVGLSAIFAIDRLYFRKKYSPVITQIIKIKGEVDND